MTSAGMKRMGSWLIRRTWSVLIIGACLLGAGEYARRAQDLYETEALALIHRNKITPPGEENVENTNRWVWVRNGLSTHEGLLTDRLFEEALAASPVLQARLREFRARSGLPPGTQKAAFIQDLRRHLQVDFKGGDIYSYAVAMGDPDPAVAIGLINLVLQRLQYLEVERPRTAYLEALERMGTMIGGLKQEHRRLDPNLAKNRRRLRSLDNRIDYLEDAYNRLDLASVLQRIDQNKMEMILTPEASVKKVWPDLRLILIAGAIAGLTLAVLFDYLFYYLRPRRATRPGRPVLTPVEEPAP